MCAIVQCYMGIALHVYDSIDLYYRVHSHATDGIYSHMTIKSLVVTDDVVPQLFVILPERKEWIRREKSTIVVAYKGDIPSYLQMMMDSGRSQTLTVGDVVFDNNVLHFGSKKHKIFFKKPLLSLPVNHYYGYRDTRRMEITDWYFDESRGVISFIVSRI